MNVNVPYVVVCYVGVRKHLQESMPEREFKP